MDVTHCLELFPSSFLHVSIDTNSFFIWATPLLDEATRHVITYLLACFVIVGTPSSIKTDNALAYTSKQFKQFLQSFSIKHITSIPYNPQAQGIVERAHHTLKLQIKNKKGKYTGTFLSSLSREDCTRFQRNILSNPITIVNTALFVLISLNLPQGDISTKAEKHFEELKDTSLPLPIWYQDGDPTQESYRCSR